jgi:hypothetical protein
MAKQACNTALHNTAAHGKIRRTRHNRAQTKARDGGKVSQGEKRAGENKNWTNVSGGFHPMRRGPLPGLRPQVFKRGKIQEGEQVTDKEGGRGKTRETDVSGGFLPKRVGSITLSKSTRVSGNWGGG